MLLTLHGASVSDDLVPDLWCPHSSFYEIFQQILFKQKADGLVSLQKDDEREDGERVRVRVW